MYNTDKNLWSWGFTSGAENWNGRLAMIGFVALVVTENFFQTDILNFLGLLN